VQEFGHYMEGGINRAITGRCQVFNHVCSAYIIICGKTIMTLYIEILKNLVESKLEIKFYKKL